MNSKNGTHKEKERTPVTLRLHRANSWLTRARREQNDPDARFIFLWIAFNAAYANDLGGAGGFSEARLFRRFVGKLCELDSEGKLYDVVWTAFPNSIRLLMENRYVFQPFWDFQRDPQACPDWEAHFSRSRERALKALGQGDTATVLAVVFDRLYVLRNQLVHGGATWNSSVNRDQVRDGADILARILPIVLEIMAENAVAFPGEPYYPVVDD